MEIPKFLPEARPYIFIIIISNFQISMRKPASLINTQNIQNTMISNS
ncbi:unnamed protein product (macronuclear) [Paramecium tetraurelia]|uniref:Uncharacterized protein n=1 Tax=Paramecium tetraurelia TaxID=5888 RepID=A0EC18_PARTE|nr:uncharacterized protein GSPATT00025571001 [Paramecium tetraurelia]CAK92835.1 unnamed protein product [Paramecium tetraurelia]|eukprot:XP_001460232.1 hypothetical protein (macronuclear) [Paramecium tetraurelia strain d4-2]